MTKHVFISYSREDYYFAESLAFHLERHSIATWLDAKDLEPGEFWEAGLTDALDDAEVVLLVASAAAFKSEHVEKEWRRALQEGKRIILINWPARSERPRELQGIEAVDFRGSFSVALSHLLSVIRGTSNKTQATISLLPWLPPWVLITSLALVFPIIGYTLAVYPNTRLDDPEMLALGFAPILQGVLLIVFGGSLVWWLCVSFIQRRMGMTRLVVCLAAIAAPFVWPLTDFLPDGHLNPGIWSPPIERLIINYWEWVSLFAAVPIVAVLAVLFWRPEDLLRWMPTGKGWQTYRVGHAVNATDAVIAAHAFENIGAFRLHCDSVDEAAAAKLSVQFQQLGSRQVDAPADVNDVANVLLVTNRTSLSWLEAKIKDLGGTVITVVGTAIALPQSLNWLWQRQWLDHRHWDLRADEREQGLPSIPESVQNVVLPRTVAIMHGLQCAYAALLFSLGGETTPEDSGVGDVMLQVELLTSLTALLGLVMLYPASQFLARSMAAPQLKRWLMNVVLGGSVLGLISLHQLWIMYGVGIEVITSFIGLVTLPILGWHQYSTVGFWLPATTALSRNRRKKEHTRAVDSLDPGPNWRTLLTFALFAVVWLMLLSDEIYN